MAEGSAGRRFGGGATSARAGAARAIGLITTAIVLVIVIGIVLQVLDANQSNDIVRFFTDVAGFFVDPFEDLFTLKDKDGEIAINWGLAAVVYLVVGRVLTAIVGP